MVKIQLPGTFRKTFILWFFGAFVIFSLYIIGHSFKNDIEKTLDIICVIMIVIGVVRLLIIHGFPVVGNLYDAFDFLDILQDSSYIKLTRRICLTASEAAHITPIVCILLLPFAMSKLLDKETVNRKKYIIYIVFLIIINVFFI